MAYLTSVWVTTVSPSELFPYQRILLTSQTLHRKGWNRVNWTVISQCRCTPRQCPRPVIIPAIHCRPANLTRIYDSNLCQWYCSSRNGQWSSHCLEETTNRPTCNSKLFKKRRMKANESKSIHVTFTTRRETCPPVHINSVQLPQEDDKYLGLHLDRRLTWHKQIFAKRKQLGITHTKMHWLFQWKSELSTSYKKQTPWSESASELYRPSDRRLSAK
jgi:hypothetical protein